MRKKILSFVLVVAMVMSLFAGMTITASAAENTIQPFTGVALEGTTVTLTLDSSKTYVVLKNEIDSWVTDMSQFQQKIDEATAMIGQPVLTSAEEIENNWMYSGGSGPVKTCFNMSDYGYIEVKEQNSYTIELREKTLLRVFEINQAVSGTNGLGSTLYPVKAAYAEILTPVYPPIDSLALTMNWNAMPTMADGSAFPFDIRGMEPPVLTDNQNVMAWPAMAVKVTADNIRNVINSDFIAMLDAEGTMSSADLFTAYKAFVVEEEYTAHPDWVHGMMFWYEGETCVINPNYKVNTTDEYGLVIDVFTERNTFPENVAVTLDETPVDVYRYVYEDTCVSVSLVHELGTLSQFASNLPVRYAVTWVEEYEGGELSVYPDSGYAAEGEPVYIRASADDGYVLESVKYYETGRDSNIFTVDMESGSGQFTMPAYPVTVVATFVAEGEDEPTEPELESLEITLIQSPTFDAIVDGQTLPDLDDLVDRGVLSAKFTLEGDYESNANYMRAQWMYAPIGSENIQEAEYDHVADTGENVYYIEITVANFSSNFLVGEDLAPGEGIYIHNEDDDAYAVNSFNFLAFEALESRNAFVAVIAPGSEEPETPPVVENVIIGNDGYPYGKDMDYSSVTLVVDTKRPVTTYQWQSSDSKNGTYTDIDGAESATYTMSYPTSGTWYRCVVKGGTNEVETSKAVQIVKPGYDGRYWTDYSGNYYVTNGTMAYRVNSEEYYDYDSGQYKQYPVFDVTGLYHKYDTAYMLQTSYSCVWTTYSSASATPGTLNYGYAEYTDYAQLDALRVSFDESNVYRVLFEADLADGQQSFSFGCDTQLGDSSTSGSYSDYAALIGTVKNNVLQQVAMIGAASQEAALGTDPAFVIAPDHSTPVSKFWLGHYSDRLVYAYNNSTYYGWETINGESVVTRVEGTDSGMTMSWLGVPSGGSVKFEFKVGSVADTGAVPGASVELTSKTITIKNTESTFFYQILDENGNPLRGIAYKDSNGNVLTPEGGWVQGIGEDIIISGLQQSTSYQIVTAAKNEEGVLDEENKAVENVITPINPGVTVDPESGAETEIVCTATGNSLTFSGLNNNYYYFLQTADGYEIDDPVRPTDGVLVFGNLPAGYELYLAAVSNSNQTYEPVLYSTNSVTVTYDANGGTNAPADQILAGEYQYLTDEIPYRAGYFFRGWATSNEAEESDYYPEDYPNLAGNTTLYAVWEEIEKINLSGTVNFNYSYSYTLPNGSVQSGTQSEGERATKVRVTLLKDGMPVGDSVVVTAVMSGNTATGTYMFENMPLTDESGRNFRYTVQAVALRDDETETRDYGVYCSGYANVSLAYSPECFDAKWKVTINENADYPVPDSIYVKVLYATEESAELEDYQVITQQAAGYGAECIRVTNANTYTYSGSYPVWKYQADVGGSYYHKFQIVGYVLDGIYVDLTDEGYIYGGEMFYNGSSASEVMELTYDTTVIPTVEVEGDILINYSYSYTLPNGTTQTGTQNNQERATAVRVELLCNGIVVDSMDVDLTMIGDIAEESYTFGQQEKYGGNGINSYSVRVTALNSEDEPANDYSVDTTKFDAILTYSPECFEAAWKVTLNESVAGGLIPSSVNVKVLYTTESGTPAEEYHIISQQADNLGVECIAVTDENGVTTYSGSYPVWKYQANESKKSYYHKIQIVGYTIDGVYYDVSYQNLISEGEMYFDGMQASGTIEQTLVPAIPEAEITVSGKVLDVHNVGVHGAKVELRKGKEVIATTTTDIYGHYSFVDVPDGDYNIVIIYKDGIGDDATEKTMTSLVGVNRESGESPNITVEMPDGNVSSKVEIKEEEVVHEKIDLSGAIVAGVDSVANNETPESNEHITIKLEITPKADVTTSNEAADAEIKLEQSEIKKKAADKTVEFLDLSLIKTVTLENDPNTRSDSNIEEASALLTIILPFDTQNTKDIVVYRYHDGVADAMKKNPEANEEGYVVGNGVVTIYTKKFSTYAIGYHEDITSGDVYLPTYTVTAPKTENGKVTLSSKYPVAGSKVTVTVEPKDGYELDKLVVTDKNGNEIEVTDLGSGTYSFIMSNRNVEVTASFRRKIDACPKDETCPIDRFTDASATEWYHDGVHYCIENGLMNGLPGNLFDPNGITTRAQIVTLLWRLEGSPVVNYAMDFVDVKDGWWYTEAIRWAASEKIVEGYGDGRFGTEDSITREQMATVLYRYAKYKDCDVSVGEDTNILSYADAFDVSDWAMGAMQWACGSGLINGVGDGSELAPGGHAIRAQAATLLWRFCERIVKF